jgi:hypothetical protein
VKSQAVGSNLDAAADAGLGFLALLEMTGREGANDRESAQTTWWVSLPERRVRAVVSTGRNMSAAFIVISTAGRNLTTQRETLDVEIATGLGFLALLEMTGTGKK